MELKFLVLFALLRQTSSLTPTSKINTDRDDVSSLLSLGLMRSEPGVAATKFDALLADVMMSGRSKGKGKILKPLKSRNIRGSLDVPMPVPFHNKGKSIRTVSGIINRDSKQKPPIIIYEEHKVPDYEDSQGEGSAQYSKHSSLATDGGNVKPTDAKRRGFYQIFYPKNSHESRYGVPLIGDLNYRLGGLGDPSFNDGTTENHNLSNLKPDNNVPATSSLFFSVLNKNGGEGSKRPSTGFGNQGSPGTHGVHLPTPINLPQLHSQRIAPHGFRPQLPQPSGSFVPSSFNPSGHAFHKPNGGSLVTPQRPFSSFGHKFGGNSQEGHFDMSSEGRKPFFSRRPRPSLRPNNRRFYDSTLRKYKMYHHHDYKTGRPKIEANYSFGYNVNNYKSTHGHQETRRGNRVEGMYHVDLPNGQRQIVRYYADETGYHPTVTYVPIPRKPHYSKMLRGSRGSSSKIEETVVPLIGKNLQPPNLHQTSPEGSKESPVRDTSDDRSINGKNSFPQPLEVALESKSREEIGTKARMALYSPPSKPSPPLIDPDYIRKSTKPTDHAVTLHNKTSNEE